MDDTNVGKSSPSLQSESHQTDNFPIPAMPSLAVSSPCLWQERGKETSGKPLGGLEDMPRLWVREVALKPWGQPWGQFCPCSPGSLWKSHACSRPATAKCRG